MGAAGTPTFHTGKNGSGSSPSGPAGGDLTGFYPNPTLVATGVVPTTYGDTTHWVQIIVDGKGRITFAQNIAATGGSGAPPSYETFTGPASSVSLAIAPTIVMPFKNGILQHKVVGPPAEGEYSISGSTLTVDLAAGDDILDVYEWA